MPNCPDPSTSSEKIWYTDAISYRDKVNCYFCLRGQPDADSDRWKQADRQRQRNTLLLEKKLFAAAKFKKTTAEKLNPEKTASTFVPRESFCRQYFWFERWLIRIRLCRLHKELWEKPVEKPHSPRSPGSGSWTRICWWTALLGRKAWRVHVQSANH